MVTGFGLRHAILSEDNLTCDGRQCISMRISIPYSTSASLYFNLLISGLKAGVTAALGIRQIEYVR